MATFTLEYTLTDTKPLPVVLLSNETVNGQLLPLVHTDYDFELRIKDASLQSIISTAVLGNFYVYFDLSGLTLTAGNHDAEIYQADKGTITGGVGTNGSVIQKGKVNVVAKLA